MFVMNVGQTLPVKPTPHIFNILVKVRTNFTPGQPPIGQNLLTVISHLENSGSLICGQGNFKLLQTM